MNNKNLSEQEATELIATKLMGNKKRNGLSKTPEYRAWRHMIERCYNPKCKRFPWYGGRGIKVCKRWQDDFQFFYHDMGQRPSETHSLDRINNDGDYEPNNCRWATRKEQRLNTNWNTIITHDGTAKSLTEWCEDLKIVKRAVAYNRMCQGWDDWDAVSMPYQRGKYYKKPRKKRAPRQLVKNKPIPNLLKECA